MCVCISKATSPSAFSNLFAADGLVAAFLHQPVHIQKKLSNLLYSDSHLTRINSSKCHLAYLLFAANEVALPRAILGCCTSPAAVLSFGLGRLFSWLLRNWNTCIMYVIYLPRTCNLFWSVSFFSTIISLLKKLTADCDGHNPLSVCRMASRVLSHFANTQTPGPPLDLFGCAILTCKHIF